MTNTNPETGIRYTTIYLNHLDGDTAAWLWGQGTNVSEANALEEIKAEVQQEIDDGLLAEEDFDKELEQACENLQIEEPTIEGEMEGVKYAISWLGGAPLLWIFESPFVAKFRLCSPCVPNACDGDSPDEDGYEGYDVPKDWRRPE